MSTKFAGTIAGRIVGRQDPVDYGVDETTRSIPANLRVWNTSTLEWDRMTQPLVEDDIETSTKWRDIRYEYDSDGNLIYKGLNATMNAATSDATWCIFRYEYTSGNLTRKRIQVTSWDDRTLGWS